MDNGGKKVVMSQMRPRERREWTKEKPHKRRLKWDKRLLRRSVPLAAAFFCLGIAAVATALFGDDVQSVMSRVTAGLSTMKRSDGCNLSAAFCRKARWSF